MAKTYPIKWLAILTKIAEESDNPKIKLEAIRLGMVIRAETLPKAKEAMDSRLAEILGVKQE